MAREDKTSLLDVASFGMGLLFGGVIGALAAFFYAPKSGAQTLETIQQKSEQAIDTVRHQVEGESISDSLEAGKAEALKFKNKQAGSDHNL